MMGASVLPLIKLTLKYTLVIGRRATLNRLDWVVFDPSFDHVWIDELEIGNIRLVSMLFFEFRFFFFVVVELYGNRLLDELGIYFATVRGTGNLGIVRRLDLLF
jgi:hypothetical protein